MWRQRRRMGHSSTLWYPWKFGPNLTSNRTTFRLSPVSFHAPQSYLTIGDRSWNNFTKIFSSTIVFNMRPLSPLSSWSSTGGGSTSFNWKPFGRPAFGWPAFGQLAFGQLAFGQLAFGQLALADRHLANWHLANWHLANWHLADWHLAETQIKKKHVDHSTVDQMTRSMKHCVGQLILDQKAWHPK